jgi:phosphoribosylformylglycinamidine cyclo-ligase
MSQPRASYRDAGVDYETLDAGKRSAIAQALARALATSPLLAARGGRALDNSRGEPAFAFELDGRTLAFVVEGLGTKSMIARQALEEQAKTAPSLQTSVTGWPFSQYSRQS